MKYQVQLTGEEPDTPEEPESNIEIAETVDSTKILSSIARKNEIFIEKVKGIILKNIAKSELNSALIADAVNLSQRQLNRKVNSVLGLGAGSRTDAYRPATLATTADLSQAAISPRFSSNIRDSPPRITARKTASNNHRANNTNPNG